MPKANNTQQQLPFILEGNEAKRELLRSVTENQDGLYKINLNIIKIRPGFNKRRKPEFWTEELWNIKLRIPELADAIFANNGPAEPPLGDIYAEDGCFYLTNGERRTRALWHLIATGRDIYPNKKPVNEVRVLLNPRYTTDLERKRKVYSTQDNMQLSTMERAYFYLSCQEEDGMTHEEIAKFLNVSRQTIDNYIMATKLPQDVQDSIDEGTTSLSVALDAHREANPQRKKNTKGVVDLESGEILSEFQEQKIADKEKEKEKLRGDEEEFEQQDNSVKGVSSIGGPKGESSGSHAIGKDAIYMDSIKLATWKQFVNRYEKVKADILLVATLENGYLNTWEDELAKRLKDEYNLTVK